MKPTKEIILTEQSTLKDFIRFFKSKPAKNWIVDDVGYDDKHCAYGFMGDYNSRVRLYSRIVNLGAGQIIAINNGIDLPNRHKGIKTRVIKYLTELDKKKNSLIK